MCVWECHLTGFTHLAFVVKYLHPWGLLCWKCLHLNAKWQYGRSRCRQPCSVPHCYYAEYGSVARDVLSECIVYLSILCHLGFNTQLWSGLRCISYSPPYLLMQHTKFPKPTVKLQISLTLVSLVTLGTSKSFKEKEMGCCFRQSVEGAKVKWVYYGFLVFCIMDKALWKERW